MGLFSPSYMRDGPGVNKNAPPKKRFFLFFELYSRKFWKIIRLNFIYILFYIPAVAGLYTLLSGRSKILSVLFFLISLVLYGPATAGMTYVLRNFAREEHAFLWSDFYDNLKSNFKQASIYGALYAVVLAVVCLAAYYYYANSFTNDFLLAPLTLCLIAEVFLFFINFYMYPMIVTFRMPLFHMLKNAAIFSIVGFFTNLITLLITGTITVLCVWFYPTSMLAVILLVPATVQFIVTFNTYPKIKKFMIDPYNEQHAADGADEEERIFSDESILPQREDENDDASH